MTPPRITLALLLLVVALGIVAGCAATPASDIQTVNSTSLPVTQIAQKSTAPCMEAVAQLNSSHPEFVKMDSDLYNVGEVIEFYVVNEGSETLTCANVQKSYSIFHKMDDGSWKCLPQLSETVSPMISYMKPGEKSRTFHFATTNWTPGEYMIIFDCGVSRKFVVQEIPKLTSP